jgi:hypothetical protein
MLVPQALRANYDHQPRTDAVPTDRLEKGHVSDEIADGSEFARWF